MTEAARILEEERTIRNDLRQLKQAEARLWREIADNINAQTAFRDRLARLLDEMHQEAKL